MNKFFSILKRVKWTSHNLLSNKGLSKVTMTGASCLTNCSFSVCGKNAGIIIGEGCNFKAVNVLVYGDDTVVVFGKNVQINASKTYPTIINAFSGANITIGDDCLFSNGVEIHSTDYHVINDSNDSRINLNAPVAIGNHVWIGMKSIILKGSEIPDNCVIGASSLVAGKFTRTNTIICGSPAKVVREQINWTK